MNQEFITHQTMFNFDNNEYKPKFKIKFKPKYTHKELLENTDFDALNNCEDAQAWLNMKPMGREIF